MLATLHVLAVENGDGIELLPEAPELIWGFVAFALLMVVMFRFVFPRINTLLEERQQAIQGQLTEAEQAKAEAEELKRSYEAQLAEARSQAETLRREVAARGEDEAAQVLARAREDGEAERARLVSELRGQVAALAVELAGKIVEKEIDAEQHRELVDAYIDELSGLS